VSLVYYLVHNTIEQLHGDRGGSCCSSTKFACWFVQIDSTSKLQFSLGEAV
jgi:hypothetical protein